MFTNVLSQKPIQKTNPLRFETHSGDPDTYVLERMSELETGYFTIMKEMTMSFHQAKLDGNLQIAQEGYMDFKKGVKQWFEKVFEYIRNFFNKSKRVLEMRGKPTDELIEKHKKKIQEFTGTIEVEGYPYTHINMEVDRTFFTTILDSYDKLINLHKTTREDLDEFVTHHVHKEYFDYVRGQIIGENQSIEAEDFGEIFLEKLRGSAHPITQEVGKDYIEKSEKTRILFDTLEASKDSSEKITRRLYRKLDFVLKEGPEHQEEHGTMDILSAMDDNEHSHPYHEDKFKLWEDICRAITTLSKQVVSITLEAFRIHAHAIKEARAQNDRILREVVAEVRKGGTN